MTGLSITDDIVVILVLLLVIGIAWLLLRSRLSESAASRQRTRADKGKVKCEHVDTGRTTWDGDERCKKKASWVTPHGYFCEDHWEINSKRMTVVGHVRWANQLAWKRNGG